MLILLLLAATAITTPPPAAPSRAETGATTVVLVRHAERAEGGGNDPSLSDAGRVRAEALASAVAGLKLDAIVVSDTKRTSETAAPAAKARGLTPRIAPTAGGAATHVKAVVDAIRAAPSGGAVLVVGHSNTLPLIVTALGGPEIPALCDGEFAPMLVLELPPGSSPRLLRASYGAPDTPGASSCH